MAADTIDCDIHPGVPDIKTLLPYMNEFWQEVDSLPAASTAST